MTGEPFFLDVAKIAITVAGFVGVVAALRHRRDEPWKLNELGGVKLMLEHSLVAVVAGLLPSVIHMYFENEAIVWRSVSALLAVFLAFEILINIVRIRHASAAGTPPRSFRLLIALFFVPTLLVLYAQVQNAIAWHSPTAFAVGALWLLVTSGIQLMHFLLHVEVAKGA